MRKLRRYCQIATMVGFLMSLQACSIRPKMAMDYLPDTAKVLIQKDIQNGHQVDEQKGKAVSVKAMLASILGPDDMKTERKIPAEIKDPITTASTAPVLLKPEDYVIPALLKTMPLPQKKPVRMTVALDVLDIIDLPLDEQTLNKIKQQTKEHVGSNITAEISVGPVAEAENMQLASLQAIAKASSISKDLKNDFVRVSIKFDPLLPRDTIKIVIKGKKRNA